VPYATDITDIYRGGKRRGFLLSNRIDYTFKSRMHIVG